MITGNGFDPDPKVAILGFPTVDVLWDGTGRDNRFARNVYGTSVPDPLPLDVPEPALLALFGPGFALVLRRGRGRA